MTLTAAPSDDTGSGITISLTAGEALTIGDVVYYKSDGKVWKTDADSTTTMPAIGIALATVSAEASVSVLLYGIYRDDSRYNWGTVGGTLYVDITTSGGLTQTMPTGTDDVIQIMGIATHADRAFINPQRPWFTHT